MYRRTLSPSNASSLNNIPSQLNALLSQYSCSTETWNNVESCSTNYNRSWNPSSTQALATTLCVTCNSHNAWNIRHEAPCAKLSWHDVQVQCIDHKIIQCHALPFSHRQTRNLQTTMDSQPWICMNTPKRVVLDVSAPVISMLRFLARVSSVAIIPLPSNRLVESYDTFAYGRNLLRTYLLQASCNQATISRRYSNSLLSNNEHA